jgi:hypothetical protein
MTIRGLNWTTIGIPFGLGVSQKGDKRAGNPPQLDICVDAQFDEIGGLQTRKPFEAFSNAIYGGGTLSDVRRLVSNGDELICFTKDQIYTYSAQYEQWMPRAEHLAIKVEEHSRFVTTGNQIYCDRAELNGVALYCWTDNDSVWVAARDVISDAVLVRPTMITGTDLCGSCRFVVLSSSVILFLHNATINQIEAVAINPVAALLASSIVAPRVSVGPPTPVGPSSTVYYDVDRAGSLDLVVMVQNRPAPTFGYSISTITPSLVVSTASTSRDSSAAIAVACTPDGLQAQVFRQTFLGTTVIHGDLITLAGFVSTFIDQPIATLSGTYASAIACRYLSSLVGGAYVCYAYWATDITGGGGGWHTATNTVTNTNVIGTQTVFAYHLAPYSQPFERDGEIYVWLGFTGESFLFAGTFGAGAAHLQNQYFLYRSDGSFHAKACSGGRFAGEGVTAIAGHLPDVQNVSSERFVFCGTERRIVPTGIEQHGYAACAPRDVAVTFDSDEARRTVRLGEALYITGGEILAYDGTNLVEVGSHIYPWAGVALSSIAGSIPDGTYAYKMTWRWDNARGESDRSTTASVGTIVITGGPKGVQITSIPPLQVTHKTASEAALEIWRTAVNPTIDAPFYLVSSNDPSQLTNPNRYIANEHDAAALATFEDVLADDAITSLETNNENGGILENLAPPPATIIAANQERIFLAGVSGDPDRVWYSKLRADEEVAAFHDALTIPVPRDGGAITGLAFLNETLIVFRERAIFCLPGDGILNDGTGENYGPPRQLSLDVGAINQESIAIIEQGLIFKSAKGWYVLNRGWGLDYIGAPVVDYDAEIPLAAHVLTDRHQVRLLSAERLLVWDYLVGQWAEWTIAGALDATLWRADYHVLAPASITVEPPTWSGIYDPTVAIDLETAWIKASDLQGFGRLRKILVLGEYRSAHEMRIRIARDYQSAYFQDSTTAFGPSAIALGIGEPLQLKIGPAIQQAEAFKIRITITPQSSAELNSECVKLTGLGLEIGIKRGPFPMLPSTQKT